MNVWYMHPYAGTPKTGMSFRPYYISQELSKLGLDTTVISSSYHHLSQRKGNLIGCNTLENQKYYFVKNNEYKGNGIGRVLNMLRYGIGMFGLSFHRFAKNNKPNVIIVSTAHPFHIFAAKYYADKYSAKLILEVRDIWPMSLNELAGLSPNHPLSRLIEITQNYAYKVCDHCVSLLANSEEYFQSKGLPSNSFSYIPNGIELGMSESHKHDIIDKIRNDLSGYDLSIGYTGAIGVPNNLMPLIKAADELSKSNVAIVLVGDGVLKEEIEQYVSKNAIDNVFIYDPVPKSVIPSVIGVFDIMFINAKPSKIYRYGISPNKIFDYMLQDKVVLNGIDAPNNPLTECGSELYFSSESPSDIVSKVLEFKCSPYSVKTSDLVLEQYSYRSLALKYKRVIESIR
ncbi:putative glycosyl transferase [Grimontia celer]|uniref:Putative glycosyl transferase n=1 Tax=Grimontia celer TaxID=1796497 RepID=A0A128F0U6_9GAMM|nr:glycosyltransferase family 4 protein [Grimontia celer]CZF80165.1 putative glycosyl transferase [Grimontia celer]